MKKTALILALIMLLAAFVTACGKDHADGSETEDQSETASGDTASGSETSGREGPDTVAVREGAYETVISTGCAYTKSVEPHQGTYPDTYGTELTDGILLDEESDNYFDESLSGYALSTEELSVVVDLGNVYENIYMFRLGYLATTQAGINIPSYVKVQYSEDGENWSKALTLKRAKFVEGTRQEANVTLKSYVAARYVKFSLRGSSFWVFLDEVMVVADVEGSDISSEFAEQIMEVYNEIGAPKSPISSAAVDRTLFPVLVSRNKSYKIDGKVDKTFPDEKNTMLTDGQYTGVYEGGTWVGFEGNQDVRITIDLGETVDDIATVEVKCYTNTGVGNFLPAAVKAVALDKDKNAVELGNIFPSAFKNVGSYSFLLPLNGAVSARYIELTVYNRDTKIVLIEECAVYAYREYRDSLLYPDIKLDETDTGAWPDASGATENLIKGLYPQVSALSDPGVYSDHNNTPITSPVLTDGNYSSGTDIHNGSFFKFWGGTGRKIYFDLGHVSGVSRFTVSFVDFPDWAVHAPGSVNILLSDDAKNWYYAGTIDLSAANKQVYKNECDLGKRVNARYVVFEFGVNGWAGADEFEVYGTKSTAGSAPLSDAGFDKYNVYAGERMAPSGDILGGLSDLVLLYNTPQNKYSEEKLITYAGYVDKEGAIRDVMFDSFLFLPGSLPSGNKTYADVTKADMNWYLTDVFDDPAGNMNALESAAGKVKQALKLPEDFKYKVTVTVMYPHWERKDFGDIDGDGVTEDLTVYENRVKVLNWFIDECEKRFVNANYKNLELVGYYWMNEDITYKDPNAKELMNAVADKAHSVGKSFFWIPYFTAPGYEAWDQYGFDIACMQPNYVFKAATPITNLISCAKLTALYNMGIEIEICDEALFNELFFDKYMAYLSYGTEYGYMKDAVHMYYQGGSIYYNAAKSDSYMGRAIYDSTYHFIKQDLKTVPDKIRIDKFNAEKNVPFHGKFGFKDDGVMRKMRVEIAADHGSVSVNDDGTFDYYPEKDYTGEVKFVFSYSEYLDWSEPMEVVISVN